MLYRTLPDTDLDLSVIGFGCWAIGGRYWGEDVEDAKSASAICAALDLGINWFDTAPLYGRADTVLSKALGARRHDVIIATKAGPRQDASREHAYSDLSPDNLRHDVEASLKRLDLETIPLLQLHWPCECGTALDDSLAELERLREEGKVRYYGLCNYDAASTLHAIEHSQICSLQTPYSMIRREFEGDLRHALVNPRDQREIGILAYETLCRGLLSGKFTSPPSFPQSDLRSRDDRFQNPAFGRVQALLAAMRILAGRLRVPVAAFASAWVCRQRGITAAIVGAKSAQQVSENVRAVELLGRDKLWKALEPHIASCRI